MSTILPSEPDIAAGTEDATAVELSAGKPLGQRARMAVMWNAAFNIFRDLNQFAVMLVLVRVLPASAYGQFNLTNTIIGFFTVFSFASFLTHTLQIKRDEDVSYQTHFAIGGIIQGSLFLLTNVAAVLLRLSATYRDVAVLVHVMSITFLLEWPTQLRLKMLERELDWKRKSLLHGVGLLGNAVLAIVLALSGAGAYALLVPGMLVTVPFIIDLFVVQRWRPEWHLRWAEYAPAFHFGLKRIGGAMLDKGRMLTESSMITAAMGFSLLGIYGRAVGLGQLICYKVATQLMYTLYPALTRMEPRTGGFQRTAGLVLRVVAWFAIPTAVLFSLVATQVVSVLYGPKWLPVVVLLPPALTVAAVSSLYHVGYTLILAHLRPSWCLALDVCLNASIVLMLFVTLPLGLHRYLLGLAVTYAALFSGALLMLIRDRALRMSEITNALVPPLAAASVSGFIIAWVVQVLPRMPALFICMTVGILFGFVYLLLLRIVWRAALVELVAYLPGSPMIRRLLALVPATSCSSSSI